MENKNVTYISGAVMKLEKSGDIVEVELYDHPGLTYFCRKGLGIKVSNAYKFGVIKTSVKKRFEIVSVEQQILKDPAFKIPGPQETTVKMPLENYKELISGKHIKIRSETLKSAIEICKQTFVTNNPDTFKRQVLNIAKDLEAYFE